MAEQRIVFNSSLPRSGSTLLQNILAQNPRFYASATSGLSDFLLAARAIYTNNPHFKAQSPELMRRAFLSFCKGGIEGFYSGITDKPVCVDKSRTWFHYYDWLRQFDPALKIVVCIRDIRAILSSMEKLFRKNRHVEDSADGPDRLNMVTIQGRMQHWINTNPVGLQTVRLLESIQTGTIKHFHVIRFEDLTSNPKAAMNKLYQYLDEAPFEHDFDHVSQVTSENDAEYPVYGDHSIREKIQAVRPDYNDVLGKEMADSVKATYPLFFKTFYSDRI